MYSMQFFFNISLLHQWTFLIFVLYSEVDQIIDRPSEESFFQQAISCTTTSKLNIMLNRNPRETLSKINEYSNSATVEFFVEFDWHLCKEYFCVHPK